MLFKKVTRTIFHNNDFVLLISFVDTLKRLLEFLASLFLSRTNLELLVNTIYNLIICICFK